MSYTCYLNLFLLYFSETISTCRENTSEQLCIISILGLCKHTRSADTYKYVYSFSPGYVDLFGCDQQQRSQQSPAIFNERINSIVHLPCGGFGIHDDTDTGHVIIYNSIKSVLNTKFL